MKKHSLHLFFLAIVTIVSCSEVKYRELFNLTDLFVENLYTTYESYGLIGGPERYTSDGQYRVMPIGRLVNVRIERDASGAEYEELLEVLQRHYKGDSRVNEVFRCQAGTLMIDCRN